MYPTLYHLVKDILGLELDLLRFINSFGLFVVLGFLAAAITLGLEIGRKTNQGLFPRKSRRVKRGRSLNLIALLVNGVIAFVFGFKVLGVVLGSPDLSDAQASLLSSGGSLFGGFFFLALSIFMSLRAQKKERMQYPEEVDVHEEISASDHAIALAMRAAIWGFIGAKFFTLIEHPSDLVDFIVNFSPEKLMSGLTIYGGLIFGTIGVLLYFRKHGMTMLAGADCAAPGVMLAYGIGRLGCHFSGDGDWGIANTAPKPSWLPDWLWSYSYPNNVNAVFGANEKGGYVAKKIIDDLPTEAYDGYGSYLDPGVWPTSVYEFLMAVVLFSLLWSLRNRIRSHGTIFFLWFVFVGIERFFIEQIRVNDDLDFFGFSMTQAEYISILIGLVGILGVLWTSLRKRKTII